MLNPKTTSLICLTFYLFHILRNLSSAYPVLLALSIFLFFISALKLQFNRRLKIDPVAILLLWFWIYASLITTLAEQQYGPPEPGLFRLWVSFPLVLVAAFLANHSVKAPMQLVAIFFVIAATSFPIQYFLGPIEWFADASERAGGLRFASLAGSLTAYGVLVGIPALAALFYFRGRSAFLIFLALTLGAALSLQKAALLNIAIAFIFAWWLKAIRIKPFVYTISALSISGFLFTATKINIETQFEAAINFFRGIITSDTTLTHDVSIYQSILDRVTLLPLEAINFYGHESLILGVGAYGGGGALGYAELPMAHNGLVELLLIFGYISGGLIALLLTAIFFQSAFALLTRDRVAGKELGFISASYIIWFTNYFFSGGGIFHPIGAALLWLILFRIRKLNANRRSLPRKKLPRANGMETKPTLDVIGAISARPAN